MAQLEQSGVHGTRGPAPGTQRSPGPPTHLLPLCPAPGCCSTLAALSSPFLSVPLQGSLLQSKSFFPFIVALPAFVRCPLILEDHLPLFPASSNLPASLCIRILLVIQASFQGPPPPQTYSSPWLDTGAPSPHPGHTSAFCLGHHHTLQACALSLGWTRQVCVSVICACSGLAPCEVGAQCPAFDEEGGNE